MTTSIRLVRRFITPRWTVTVTCVPGTPVRELFESDPRVPGDYLVRVEFRPYTGGLHTVTLALRQCPTRSRDAADATVDRHGMPAIRATVAAACRDARAVATALRRNAPRTITRRD